MNINIESIVFIHSLNLSLAPSHYMLDFCWIYLWMQSEFLSQPKGSQSGFKTCIFTLRENINATHVVKLENWTLYLMIIWEALPWDIRRINSLNLNPLLIPAKCLSNLPKYSAPWKILIPCYNIKGVEFLDSLEWNGSMSSSFFVANLINKS